LMKSTRSTPRSTSASSNQHVGTRTLYGSFGMAGAAGFFPNRENRPRQKGPLRPICPSPHAFLHPHFCNDLTGRAFQPPTFPRAEE
jgi:hypothetical protein